MFKIHVECLSCAGERTASLPAEAGPDEAGGEVRIPPAVVLGVRVEAGLDGPHFHVNKYRTTIIVSSPL